MTHAEEIAEGRLDARLRFVVPVDIQHDLADVEFLRADAAFRAAFVRVADGAEKVRDDTGTLQVGEEIRLAGGNEDIVVIAAVGSQEATRMRLPARLTKRFSRFAG